MTILILILIFSSANYTVEASENKTYYARILFEQVYLYKSPIDNNNYDNVYFELPKTYFVELLSRHEDFYEARYLNFTGYVKKDSVQAVSSTPKKPFLTNITFRVYAEMSEQLKSSPTAQSTLIVSIPHLTKNITYLGKINGESLIEGRTNMWYYCKYSLDKDYYGYIYSDFCDEMPEIQPNTEELTYTTNPSFEKPKPPTNTIPVTNNAVGIVIAILSIPALIFVFLLMKGTRILNKPHIKNKEVVDY